MCNSALKECMVVEKDPSSKKVVVKALLRFAVVVSQSSFHGLEGAAMPHGVGSPIAKMRVSQAVVVQCLSEEVLYQLEVD